MAWNTNCALSSGVEAEGKVGRGKRKNAGEVGRRPKVGGQHTLAVLNLEAAVETQDIVAPIGLKGRKWCEK